MGKYDNNGRVDVTHLGEIRIMTDREAIAQAIEAEGDKSQAIAGDLLYDDETRMRAATAAYIYRNCSSIARTAPLPGEGGWVAVGERLPGDSIPVLTYSDTWHVTEAKYWRPTSKWYRGSSEIFGVTHWMAFPAHPLPTEPTA